METITRINGNKQAYTSGLPDLIIMGHWNSTALAHITENTGLIFKPNGSGGMIAKPETSQQIAVLFMTYNFKSRYYDNWMYKNTLLLKHDHHTGFDVDSICYNCVKENHIHTNGMEQGQRLSC